MVDYRKPMEIDRMDTTSVSSSESPSGVFVYDIDSLDSEKEQALIKNIRKLAHENQTIKLGLANHNKLITKYCDDLENLRNLHKEEKEKTMVIIQRLQADNDGYKLKLDEFSMTAVSIQGEKVHELLNKIRHFVNGLVISFDKNKASLPFPVEETQYSLHELQLQTDELEASILNVEKESLHPDLAMWRIREEKMNQQIESLKCDLSERMKNDEEIQKLQSRVQEMEEIHKSLTIEKKKLKESELLLLQKIEQLEVEPSVEIMQVASPQQTKIIDNLHEELAKAKDQIKALVEENECFTRKVTSLNEVCQKLNEDASKHSMLEGKELSAIVETYEAAIKGMKDEIEKQRQCSEELRNVNTDLSENLEEQRKLQSTDLEESANMRRTIEMLRKRESRDLDKLNQVTVERDVYKKESESNLSIIKKLSGEIDALKANPDAISNVAQNNLGHAAEFVDQVDLLKRQLSSGEQTIGILSEENTNLKTALRIKTEECSCEEMLKKIDLLVEENESLLENLAKKDREIQDHSITELDEVKKLQEKVAKLEVENDNLVGEFKQKQLKDNEIIQCLNEKLMAYHDSKRDTMEEVGHLKLAVEDERQKNDVLEARLEKMKNDYTKLWQTYEINIRKLSKFEQKVKEMEELNKDARLKQVKMQNYIDENYEQNKKTQQMLMNKDREIESLKSELQRIDVYKAQVEIYEKDFDMERKARENQHGDMLLLREEMHRLELENNRLRDEVESGQMHNVKELQRRFASSSPHTPYPNRYDAGIYGRGGPPASDSGMGYNRYDYRKGSIEVPPMEPDQVLPRTCPKCHAPFPDLDSLQIHVLECVD